MCKLTFIHGQIYLGCREPDDTPKIFQVTKVMRDTQIVKVVWEDNVQHFAPYEDLEKWITNHHDLMISLR